MKFRLLLPLLLFTISLTAQNRDKSGLRPWREGITGFHLAPLSLFGFHPRVRAGFFQSLDQKRKFEFAVDGEIGFPGLVGRGVMHGSKTYTFWGFRPEFRYYPEGGRDPNGSNFFLAVELPYTYLRRSVGDAEAETIAVENVLYDRVEMERERFSLIGKVGKFYRLGANFYLFGYVGAGIARREVRYVNGVNPLPGGSEEEGNLFDGLGDFTKLRSGRRHNLELAFGVQIGYLIW